MKKILLTLSLSLATVFVAFSQNTASAQSAEIKWMSWEEAIKLCQTKPKKLMIDVYTDWCGWCKRMDKSTFMDAAVVKNVSENFYAVKLNAEQKADIQFGNDTLKFIPNDDGRGGVHQLAYALLDGRMGYPTLVYLNEKYERIMISPGYKEPGDLMKELKFAAEELYTKTTWDKYKDGK